MRFKSFLSFALPLLVCSGLNAAASPLPVPTDQPSAKSVASLQALTATSNLKVELAASDSNLLHPVAMQFDDAGRIWVLDLTPPRSSAMRKSLLKHGSEVSQKAQQLGRVVILSDLDNDGYYEHRSVFADRLTNPQGLAIWGQRIFTTLDGRLAELVDRNKDDHCDELNFLLADHPDIEATLVATNPISGPDGWLYISNDFAIASVIERLNHRDTSSKPVEASAQQPICGFDARINLLNGKVQLIACQSRCGASWDRWHGRYVCSGSTPCSQVLWPAFSTATTKATASLLPPCQIVVDATESYNAQAIGNHFESQHRYQALTIFAGVPGCKQYAAPQSEMVLYCDLSSGQVLQQQMYEGNSIRQRLTDQPPQVWLQSKDESFSPTDVSPGPDGSVYVIDSHSACIFRVGTDQTFTARQSQFDSLWLRPLRHRTESELLRLLDNTPSQAAQMAFQLLAARPHQTWLELVQNKLHNQSSMMVRLQLLELLGVTSHLTAGDLTPQFNLSSEDIDNANYSSALWRLAMNYLSDESEMFIAAQQLLTQSPSMDNADALWYLSLYLQRHDTDISQSANEAIDNVLADSIAGQSPRLRQMMAIANLAASQNVDVLDHLCENCPAQLQRDNRPIYLSAASLQLVEAIVLNSFNIDQVSLNHSARVSQWLQAMSDVSSNPNAMAKQRLWDLAMLNGLLRSKHVMRVEDAESISGKLVHWFNDAAKIKQLAQTIGLHASLQARDANSIQSQIARSIGLLDTTLAKALTEKILQDSDDAELTKVLLGSASDGAIVDSDLLIENFPSWSGDTRQQAFEILLSSRENRTALVVALTTNRLQANDLTPLQWRELSVLADPSLQGDVLELLQSAIASNRQTALQKYLPAISKKSDVAKGKILFGQHCSQCHRLDGIGSSLGPDLQLQSWDDPLLLLTAILNPNHETNERYTVFEILQRDGQRWDALIVDASTQHLDLLTLQSRAATVAADTVASIVPSNLSMMPIGFELQLDVQQMSDLLQYIAEQTESR